MHTTLTNSRHSVPNKLLIDSRERLSKFMTNQDLITHRAPIFAFERFKAQKDVQDKLIPITGVLFLCGHNAGRSQMSAAWFNHLLQPQQKHRPFAYSAGSMPAQELNLKAIQVMQELGIDMTPNCFPKPWTREVTDSVQLIVNMGCGDTCPIMEGVECRNWNLKDPHGQDVQAVRLVRNEIMILVKALVQEVFVTNSKGS
jgi:arsenate reductase